MKVDDEVVEVVENAAAQMRDGVALRSDVYRPRHAGPLPVLVCRTPYGKRGETFGSAYAPTARGLARRGYIVVVQDVRGRYASSGVYRWLYGAEAAATHAQDGYDTIEWAATLPGSSGIVGTWGNSYDGYTSLRAAGAAPPSLSAVFASGVAERLHDETFGIFKPIYLEWTHAMAADLRARADKLAARSAAASSPDVWTLPYDAIDGDAFADLTAPFKRFLREQEIDRWALHETQPNIRVPVCHLTGWWDYVCRGTAAHYTGLRQRGAAGLHELHRLVIGPWSHRTGRSAAGVGAVDYGPAEHVYYHDEIADWYDYAFKGEDPGSYGSGAVKLFVLNENRWHFYDSWPVPWTQDTRFFLHSRGAANTPHGDGHLSMTEPAASKPSRYIYDPGDPVMSLSTWSSRAIDQSVNDGRQDILVYVTEPLESSLLVIGDASCTLWASSDAQETDFTAKLVEVRPGGRSIELAAGILRTRFLDGYESAVQLEPGTPYELTINLGPVGVRFESGSRIRLDISSSDFPNFDRNHNTGMDYWSDTELRPAHQAVYSEAHRPSYLTLPVCQHS
ncbi:MAG TPA: hypothetical protein DHU96_27625 [Actinobacteria bacterium]|nr:hypothetical protein [Actinomycetota bacterium]